MTIRHRYSLAVASFALCSVGFAQQAVKLDIESQPLDRALNAWATQTGYQVLIPVERAARGRSAPPVKGHYTPEGALKVLLASSDLKYEFVNARTVTIRQPAREETDAGQKSTEAIPPLAQAPGRPRETEEAASGTQSSRASDRSATNGTLIAARTAQGASERTFEEVIVTAQRREERLIDVPISIVSMSAEELGLRNVDGLDDLSLAVPGLSVQSSGTGQRRIMLRGISNVFGSNSSLIGLYLDEAPVTTDPTRQLDLRANDLERVEVLRGPQGTLYGEGSVGGTIRFITRNPELDRFGANADLAAMFTEDGDPGQRLQGVVNVPLIENQLGLRIAGTMDRNGGWINQSEAGRTDFNDQELVNIRTKMLWQPTAQFSINAMAIIHRNDAPPSVGEDDDGDFSQAFGLTTTPSVEDDYDVYNLSLNYDAPGVRILSSTSYIGQDKRTHDFGNRLQFGPPGTPPLHQYLPDYIQLGDIFTEELRFTSSGDGAWQWTAGGFYRRSHLQNSLPGYYFGLPAPDGTLPAPFWYRTDSLSKSWAVFGDTSLKLTDRLTAGVGLRYFEDDQEYATNFSVTGPAPLDPAQSGTFDSLNPRAYLQFKLSDNVNTYASAAKGFRSGGFNQTGQPAYDPEEVWTYELGTKMALAENRVSIDAALFYSDYSDYQINGFASPTDLAPRYVNAGSARIRGIELAVALRPTDEWSLTFSGDYVDSELYEINATSTSHTVGDPLDLFPKYSLAASVQREFSWAGRPGHGRLDYNQHGRSTFRNRTIGPWYFDESDVINLMNFNLSMQWNDMVSFGLFAQNLLDERGYLTSGWIEGNAARPRPRTYGIELGVSF